MLNNYQLDIKKQKGVKIFLKKKNQILLLVIKKTLNTKNNGWLSKEIFFMKCGKMLRNNLKGAL